MKKETVLSVMKDIRDLLRKFGLEMAPDLAQPETPAQPAQFVDNGDGTATDKVTGLMWLVNDVTFCGLNGLPLEKAKEKVATWGYAGHDNWRVPDYYELISLVKFDGKKGLMDDIFNGHRTGYFWTSQDYVPNPATALVVGFNNGRVVTGTKTSAYYVRPVRGGRG